MSCEIVLTAALNFENLISEEERVCQFSRKNVDYYKSDESNFEDSAKKNGKTVVPDISEFKVAVSPTGEVIAFAKKSRFFVFESKWNSSGEDPKINYVVKKSLDISQDEQDEITSLLCLPFFSQGQSIHGCADWTCIVVGFESGCIRFYTEKLEELACSILHEEPITGIKCHSPITMQQSKTQKQDNSNLYILYKTTICIVNKTLLSQTLHNKRCQLAKNYHLKTNEFTPVDHKKYSFVEQEEVTDACFIGQGLGFSTNTFDHLVAASLVGGFNSQYRASPPQTSLIVTSGKRPFMGFYYTVEGASSSVFADVASAVVSKLKDRVTATLPFRFVFGEKKTAHPEKPKEVAQEYAEKLGCRFGLCDLWRHGQSVIISPDGLFSAISDSLGRVMLVDNSSGIAHRMWKGYRDAQCGFIQVKEDIQRSRRSKDNKQKPHPRQGLFIVIYAPKTGIIDIFATQHGKKVASYKGYKNCKLIYVPRSLGSVVTLDGLNLTLNQVLVLSEGTIKEFFIPFHCALEENNSKLSRDLHILKKMKLLLKTESHSNNPNFVEEIEKCAKELKTDEVRLQAVESMVTYKNTTLEAFKAVLKIFLDNLKSQDRDEPPPRKFLEFAETTFNLLLFYEFFLHTEHSESTKEFIETTSNSEDLKLPEKELNLLLKLIGQIKEIEGTKKQSAKVTFEEKKSTKLGLYLSCFDFESFLSHLDKMDKEEDTKKQQILQLHLKNTNKETKHVYLGEVFFRRVFSSTSSLEEWKRHAQRCNLSPIDLSLCLLSYWSNKTTEGDVSSEVSALVEILKTICSLTDPKNVSVEYNVESPWWLKLQTFIATNPNTIRGLFAALSCRSVTIFVEQEKELRNLNKKETGKAEEGSNDALGFNSDWESISKDTCQWDILITQLQDVALLNAILSLSFKTGTDTEAPPQVPFDFEYQSLSSIQENGSGRVAELVAKWMVQFTFDPKFLINKNDIEFQSEICGEGDEKKKGELVEEFDKANAARENDPNLNLALNYLDLLKTRFPYSLTSSSLLGNMSWEYITYWFKNPTEIEYLQAAIRYLEVVPSDRIKYGISFLSWKTYLERKFESLAKVMNRLGNSPRNKFCLEEAGIRNDQLSHFFRLTNDFLEIMFHTDVDDSQDFEMKREAIWQNSSTTSSTSLLSVALSQPLVNPDLAMFRLQLSYCLLMMSGLYIEHPKIFSTLFYNVDHSSFTLSENFQISSHHHKLDVKHSRTTFLQKVISAAVQTIEVVEFVLVACADEPEECETAPSTRLKVDAYQKWLQLCFDLAGMWAISLDDLRRHHICELYANGYDRLAEEVIRSVSDITTLALQLLVLGGKRLKYIIQTSEEFHKKFTNLSANLSSWLETLDLENFTCQCDSIDDIEAMMSYIVKWIPEGDKNQKLAIDIIESLPSLRT